MAVTLQVDDGNPWWLSPDIWTVPGPDPNGAAGVPTVGQPCYVWARVHNLGTDSVQGATVRFWWANPGTNFDRSTATQISTSYVDLNAGDTQDVLCLTPWDPSFVNGGHECLVVEAFQPNIDPLPPGPDFSVPTDRHVAQRNLNLLVSPQGHWVVPFEVHNRSRSKGTFEIRAEQGELKSITALRAHLPHIELGDRPGKAKIIGFADELCPSPESVKKGPRRLELAGNSRAGLSIVFEASGGPVLVNVTQSQGDRVVGGLSILGIRQTGRKS